MENPCGPSFFSVCVVGVGSVGQCVLRSLPDVNGIALTLIDGDTVEAHNIGRQPLCTHGDVGRHKVEVVRERLAVLSPELPITGLNTFIDARNARELLAGHAVVLDCTDDLHVRYLIDDTCGSLSIPLISGSVHGKEGQVVLLHAKQTSGTFGPSLRDLFPGRPSGAQDGCDMRDVPSMLPQRVAEHMLMHYTAVRNEESIEAGVLELIGDRAVIRFAYPPGSMAQRTP